MSNILYLKKKIETKSYSSCLIRSQVNYFHFEFPFDLMTKINVCCHKYKIIID
jgi:hypothetical protein